VQGALAGHERCHLCLSRQAESIAPPLPTNARLGRASPAKFSSSPSISVSKAGECLVGLGSSADLRLLASRRSILPMGAGLEKLPAGRPSTDRWRPFLYDLKSRRPKKQVCAFRSLWLFPPIISECRLGRRASCAKLLCDAIFS